MRLRENQQALAVAVFLALILGVITATYMTLFPPSPSPVSCTTATGCAVPDRQHVPYDENDPDDMTDLVN